MNAVDTNGQLPEHKPEPMTEAGCECKVSRNVQGTAPCADLAQHRARALQMKEDAIRYVNDALEDQEYELCELWEVVEDACRQMMQMIDARSNAKDAST